MFFHEVVATIDKTLGNKVIQWSVFEGYEVLLQTYLKYYSDFSYTNEYIRSIDATVVTSIHPMMVNFFMKAYLSKVNLFDAGDVLSLL